MASVIADKVFPMPEGMDTIYPMRGHRVQINPGDTQYGNILKDEERDHDPFFVFKPDWFIQEAVETNDPLESIILPPGHPDRLEGADRRKIEVIPAGGSLTLERHGANGPRDERYSSYPGSFKFRGFLKSTGNLSLSRYARSPRAKTFPTVVR